MAHHATSGFAWGTDVTGLVIGVIGAFLSLGLLFSIKPRLRLTLRESSPQGKLRELGSTGWTAVPPLKARDATSTTHSEEQTGKARYSVQVENLGLGSVVELEARLWLIHPRASQPDERTKIDVKVDKLLELSGKWRECRRTEEELLWGSVTGFSGSSFRTVVKSGFLLASSQTGSGTCSKFGQNMASQTSGERTNSGSPARTSWTNSSMPTLPRTQAAAPGSVSQSELSPGSSLATQRA
jgi:hypothetical protein